MMSYILKWTLAEEQLPTARCCTLTHPILPGAQGHPHFTDGGKDPVSEPGRKCKTL